MTTLLVVKNENYKYRQLDISWIVKIKENANVLKVAM